MPERICSIAGDGPAAYAQPMAKRATDKLAVRVDPYSARPMMARGERDGRWYYRIRQAGEVVSGTSGWYTAAEVRDRMLDLLLGEREQKRQAEVAKRAADEPWTVQRLMAAWVGTVVRHLPSESSRRNYEIAAIRLIVAGGDVRLDRVTRETMIRLMNVLARPETVLAVHERRRAKAKNGRVPRLCRVAAAEGYSGHTINNTMSCLRNAWRWAAELGHAPALVPRFRRRPTNPVLPDYIPTAEEAKRVFAAIPSVAVQRALYLIFKCGCRIDEMAARVCGDVRRIEETPDGSRVWLHFGETKTGRDRLVPFLGDAAELILEMAHGRPSAEPLFVHAGRSATARETGANQASILRQEQLIGRPVTCNFKMTIGKAIREVPFEEMGIRRFTPKALRSLFINQALNAGELVDFVAKCCGNSPPTIWKYYRRVDDQNILGVVERVSAIDAGKVVPLRSGSRRPEQKSGTGSASP